MSGLRSMTCNVCKRRIAIERDGLRQHKAIDAWLLAHARRPGAQPNKAEREIARNSPWCNGPERQLALPL